jgi:3',5'-cyclic AMP phosphodiesterase CpdA
MIAITKDYGTILATDDEWGLVQNSLALSGEVADYNTDGWETPFTVNGERYRGRGWHIPRRVGVFILEHRKDMITIIENI